MISSTFREAIDLLNKWREEECWLGAKVIFAGPERHDFWAKVSEVSDEQLRLDGESATVFVKLDSQSFAAGYMGSDEIPAEVHRRMDGGMEFCFSIRSNKVNVFLFGQRDQDD